MSTGIKDQVLRVRCDDTDRERLTLLASHYEMSEAAIVRLLIKDAADRLNATGGASSGLPKSKTTKAKPTK